MTDTIGAKGGEAGPNHWVDRLSSPAAVLICWAGFGLVFGAIQLLSSSTLTMDTAVTTETVQRHLAPAYQIRNPPLFDWMFYFVRKVFGDGILAHSVLRYSLIAAVGVLYYAAFLQVSGSRRIAAAFSYSLIFFVWLASDIHYHFTHSLPLLAVGLACWVTAVAYIERQTSWLAALLGFLLGLGAVAKWSFPLPLAGAAIAFALDARARSAFARWRSLLIPVMAFIPIAPVAYWLLSVDANLIFYVRDVLVTDPAPYAERLGIAVWKYLTSIVLFLLPWPIFIGVIAYRTRVEGVDRVPRDPTGRLAASMTLWTIGLGLLGVAALGVDNMGMRYMFPVLLIAPVAVAAWIAPRVDDMEFAGVTFAVAMVAMIVAVIVRIWSFQVVDGVFPVNARQRVPFGQLAHELTLKGLANAQFIASGERDAGNLLGHLPEARAVSLTSIRVEPPPPDSAPQRTCVALWGREDWTVPGEPGSMRVPEVLAPIVASATTPQEDIIVDWRSPLYGDDRKSLWRIVPLPDDSPACLEARGLPGGK